MTQPLPLPKEEKREAFCVIRLLLFLVPLPPLLVYRLWTRREAEEERGRRRVGGCERWGGGKGLGSKGKMRKEEEEIEKEEEEKEECILYDGGRVGGWRKRKKSKKKGAVSSVLTYVTSRGGWFVSGPFSHYKQPFR